jgi:hypothetical protein
MKKILINYAALGTNHAHNQPNQGYVNAQKINSETGINIAKFNEVINYNSSKLPPSFFSKHEKHFKYTRGAGYWVWKPFIILDALNKIQNNDILMYSDSGCHFINTIEYILPILDASKNKVLVFNLAQIEKDWTKRDCFVTLGCDKSEFTDSKQIMSTFFLCKKSDFAIHVVNEWYKLISDFHMVADEFISPSVNKNYDSFKEHRHDQSLLSLVSKLNNVDCMEDITEWGDPKKRNTPQIVKHTRKRD